MHEKLKSENMQKRPNLRSADNVALTVFVAARRS